MITAAIIITLLSLLVLECIIYDYTQYKKGGYKK